MAFANKMRSLLRQVVSSNPSIYQTLRCMSSSKLFIGGLSYSTDDQGLREAFSDELVTGTVYVHKNESGSASVLRRIKIESDGNLHLYEWDNGSRWVSQWSAVSNPCQVAGICGGGICTLDGNNSSGASCKSLPQLQPPTHSGNCSAEREMQTNPQTNYYFSGASTIANCGFSAGQECAEYCLSDCGCVASVYGIEEDETYCWTLSSMQFGGLQDPSSTLYIKIGENQTSDGEGQSDGSTSSSSRNIQIVLPLLFCFCALIVLLSLLLGFSIKKKRKMREIIVSSSLSLPGAPSSFSYHDLQIATNNFSRLLGTDM